MGQTATHIWLIDSRHFYEQYAELDRWLDRDTQAYRVVMLVSSRDDQNAAEALRELQLQ